MSGSDPKRTRQRARQYLANTCINNGHRQFIAMQAAPLIRIKLN